MNQERYTKAIGSRQMFFKVSVLKRLRNIHRKTPVLGSLFHKIVGRRVCNFIKKRLQYRCSL